jgi:hypothetical protein
MTALQPVADAIEAQPTTAFLVLDGGRIVLDRGATTSSSPAPGVREVHAALRP